MEVIGPFAIPMTSTARTAPTRAMEWTAQIAPSYFNNRKVSIFGGSNEIQRNIITKACWGFGSPRQAPRTIDSPVAGSPAQKRRECLRIVMPSVAIRCVLFRQENENF